MKNRFLFLGICGILSLTSCEILGLSGKKATKLELKKEKTDYKVGEEFNLDDLTASIFYSDNSSKTVNFSSFSSEKLTYKIEKNDVEMASFNTFEEAGEYKLVVVLHETTALKSSIDINVTNTNLLSVEIEAPQNVFYVGDKLSDVSISATLNFDNENKTKITESELSKYGLVLKCENSSGSEVSSLSKAGKYKIYVINDEKTIKSNEIEIEVKTPIATFLDIEKVKTDFEVDENFDYSDLKLNVSYDYGGNKTFTGSNILNNGFKIRLYKTTPTTTLLTKFTKEGTYKLDVIHISTQVVSNVIEINVAPIPLTEIVIENEDLSYSNNSKFDGSDLNVTLKFRSKSLSVAYSEFENYDLVVSIINDATGNSYNFKSVALATGTYTLSISSGEIISNSIKINVFDADTYTPTTLRYKYSDVKSNSPYSKPIASCPTTGNVNLLVVPVWFKDSATYIDESMREYVRDDIGLAYSGSEEETGWHSIKSFYETESLGKLNLNVTLSDWYEDSHSSTDYYSSEGGATTQLVNRVTEWYFSNNPDVDRQQYDSNKDGFIDGVMVIYASPNYATLGLEENNMWAYCFNVQQKGDVNKPVANSFFWASYDFLYGANNVGSRTGNYYYAGDCKYANIDTHCFIHEMGHVFGLQDYYDYSRQYSPAGGFTMQDNNVGGHDAYSVMAYGWAKPHIVKESSTLTIKDFQSSHEAIILTPSWNNYNSPFDEYLLLELYTPTGLNEFDTKYRYREYYPQGLDEIGIRLWHVDARLYSYATQRITTNPKDGLVLEAMSNTYYNPNVTQQSPMSPLGKNYANFNTLQLISKSLSVTYQRTTQFDSNDLWKAGDTFTMNRVQNQFVRSTRLNTNSTLGWSFTVKECKNNKAIIEFTKG